MRDPHRLLEPALRLPPETRAVLAESLLKSLDLDVDATHRDSEIAERLRELESRDAGQS